jgi:hypothetical protein
VQGDIENSHLLLITLCPVLREHGAVILAADFQNCLVNPNEVSVDFKAYIACALLLQNQTSTTDNHEERFYGWYFLIPGH